MFSRFMRAGLLVLVLGQCASVLCLRLPPSASCNSATWPSRSRASWCERKGQIDEFISFEQIGEGRGLCLDGQCYDSLSLRRWLALSDKLPHNRAFFTLEALNAILGTVVLPVKGYANIVSFSEHGHLATGSSNGIVQLWSVSSGEQLEYFKTYAGVDSLQFSADGQKLLTGSWEGTVQTWNILTGLEIARINVGYSALSRAGSVFSPDGSLVLSPNGVSFGLWNSTHGNMVRSIHALFFTSNFVFLPLRDHEVCAGVHGGSVKCWDTQKARSRSILQTGGDVLSVAFSPHGTMAVTRSIGAEARIWNVSSGEMLHQLRGHTGSIFSAVFSSDGRRVLTSSADRTARLWDARSGAELRRFEAEDMIRSVAMSPSGHLAMACDGQVRVIFDAAAEYL